MCVCICTSMLTCALVPVHLCVWALISMSRSSRLRQMLIAFVFCMTVCAYTYSYDVNKVIFSQGVQDCINGVLGYCQSESLHAATDIHDDYYIFRRCGCLYIPKRTQRERRSRYKMHYNLHLTPSMTRLGVMYCQSSSQEEQTVFILLYVPLSVCSVPSSLYYHPLIFPS